MVDRSLLSPSPKVYDMSNIVHIDEKWFYMSKLTKRYYLVPGEDDPVRTCKSKTLITKVMFLAAVAQPRFDTLGNEVFSGKIGIFPLTTLESAKRSSKNRVTGTLETKPILSVTKDVTRSWLIEKVLPAIRAKWPRGPTGPIFIQQDNARPHIDVNNRKFLEASSRDGLDIRLFFQPLNSPDLNVLDLGFFFEQYNRFKSKRIWVTLMNSFPRFNLLLKECNHVSLTSFFNSSNMYEGNHEGSRRQQLSNTTNSSNIAAVPHTISKKILKSTKTSFRMAKSTFVDFEPACCEAPEVDPTVENEDTGSSDGMDGFLSDLANSIPGIDEAMSFAEMLKLVQTMDYSVIVFDTAPTGHTLRLLQFPSTLEKGLDKMMSLKNKFGGLISQATRMFGMGEEFGEDAILGKLESMKDVIEQVNRQFKDPDMTTFVCVCIPEFLSLYETERLVQELTKFEIDTHNIIINQVLFYEEGVESKLLKARMKMQQKYLDQFYMLYDDFNITKLPLLPQEVCGVEALKAFSQHFLKPYQPLLTRGTIEELEVRVSTLQEQLKEAETELEKARKGKKPL
ncbi:ATPase ARSA2-like protein [Tanacetum coccineum]